MQTKSGNVFMSVRIFGRLPAENFLSVQMPPASAVKASLKMQFTDLYCGIFYPGITYFKVPTGKL